MGAFKELAATLSEGADAPFHLMDEPITDDWRTVDWKKVIRKVRRLQTRIAKATKDGKWRLVKSLQRLLTHSYYAKLLAVRKVTENRGKRTAGVDGEVWSTPESKIKAAKRLGKAKYKPKPLRRVYIPKRNGKKRPLGIPTMYDRAMQALYLSALEPVSEMIADYNSYGFRRNRSTQDAIAQTFNCLSSKTSSQWILEGDIKGCFDHISHDWMLNNICTDKSILRKWLKAGFVDNNHLYPTTEGTPQGGIISPALANLVLDGMEEMLASEWKKTQSQTYRNKVNFVRYADDFIVTGANPEILEEIKNQIKEFLRIRGLKLSEEKTRITHIDDGFDFLGFNVRKYNGKLLIQPSKSAIKNFKQKIRETVKRGRAVRADVLIHLLNPILRGWSQYYRTVVSKKIFASLDHWLWHKLYRWALRRHPMKGKKWIVKKYFSLSLLPDSVDRWMFTGRQIQGKPVQIIKMSKTPIKRHVKIKSAANPFLPEWESYFEERTMKSWLKKRSKYSILARIFRSQSGKCPICGELITEESGLNLHHLIPKVEGGGSNITNLMLLHPICHRQVHSKGNRNMLLGVQTACLIEA
ncbi:MAG: group II intron reverse transcriptase/maturase [Candidatus Electryoneaceae bacterium]|nr:group II intron reverse transcriptase/maturase [Candidatus Electryoneaceae bacterium]